MIPFFTLTYHEVQLHLLLNDDTQPIPDMNLVYVVLRDSDCKRATFKMDYHIFKRKTNPYKYVIKNGMLGLFIL